jgi:hypothetical protein
MQRRDNVIPIGRGFRVTRPEVFRRHASQARREQGVALAFDDQHGRQGARKPRLPWRDIGQRCDDF